MNKYRTHNLPELNEKDNNKIVTLSYGYILKEIIGNLLSISDHFGLTQCVVENKNNK